MKKISTLCVLLVFLQSKMFSQSLPSGAPANFGADGDVKSNYRLVGSWNPAGTHDWFKNTGTTALGVIDTTGAANAAAHLVTGENYVFNMGMSVPRYSVQDGYLVLDSRYARDYFGFSSSGPTSDLTSFGTAQKNGFNPGSWLTTPSGGAVADKSDIIDAYVHMRRNGSIVSGASSSHLIAVMGASTAANNGTRFFDVEFFCSSLSYNSATGVFSNSGPAATGGHTAWTFNPDGSVQQFGDMSIAFSFTGSDVSEIAIWVWVSLANYTTVNPAGFDFVSGEFYGATPLSLYGYAKIKPNSGNIAAWGSVNTAITNAAAWGTVSKSLGSNGNNYYNANYDISQLGEAAIDLTALGIDPAMLANSNACTPPFRRVLIKSRSSSTFTSALQDFAGPYEFLDAPTSNPAIAPAVLNCQASTVTLRPQNIQSGNYYHWSTTTGNMTSNPDSTYVSINKPGKYYLQSSVYQGCALSIDSLVVSKDDLQPVATASASGILTTPQSTVVLFGGDPTASNVPTSFGGSMGLTYSWSGPAGYTSNVRNPVISQEGDYELIITEIRNGCKDTAATTVLRTGGLLPVHLISLQGNMNKNNKVTLEWKVADNQNVNHFEVQRSSNGKDFATIGIVLATEKTDLENYMFYETVNNTEKVMYRLRMVDKQHDADFSKILVFQNKSANSSNQIKIFSNPVNDKVTFSYTSSSTQSVDVKVYDMTGRLQLSRRVMSYEGSNMVSLPLSSTFKPGFYFVELNDGNERQAAKFVKQ